MEDHRRDLFKGEGRHLKGKFFRLILRDQRGAISVLRDIREERADDNAVEERGRETGKLIRVSVQLQNYTWDAKGVSITPLPLFYSLSVLALLDFLHSKSHRRAVRS